MAVAVIGRGLPGAEGQDDAVELAHARRPRSGPGSPWSGRRDDLLLARRRRTRRSPCARLCACSSATSEARRFTAATISASAAVMRARSSSTTGSWAAFGIAPECRQACSARSKLAASHGQKRDDEREPVERHVNAHPGKHRIGPPPDLGEHEPGDRDLHEERRQAVGDREQERRDGTATWPSAAKPRPRKISSSAIGATMTSISAATADRRPTGGSSAGCGSARSPAARRR